MDDYRIDTDDLVLGIVVIANAPRRLGWRPPASRLNKRGPKFPSSAQERQNYGPISAWWRPRKPTTQLGQIAAATYLLGMVPLLKFVSERSCLSECSDI